LIPYHYDLKRRGPHGDQSVVQGSDNSWVIPFTTDVATDFAAFATRSEFRFDFKDYAPNPAIAAATASVSSDADLLHHTLFLYLPNSTVFMSQEGRWDAEQYTLNDLGEDELVYRIVYGVWELSQEVTE